MTDRRPRILLAKPGLDGHDRGLKVVAMALRDTGAEIIYLGHRRTIEQILAAARDENVDLIGVSLLSGAHLALIGRLLERAAELGLADIPVVVGGTIPPRDAEELRNRGVAAVYPVGTPLDAVVASVLDVARQHQGVHQ